MKSFSQVHLYLHKYMMKYVQEGNPEVVAALKQIGRDTIERAAEVKTPGNITMNQMEGFAYAVFFNGNLVEKSIGFLDKKRDRGEHVNKDGKIVRGAQKDRRGKMGRIEALNAIKNYVPDSKGYVLFLTNAVWYSMIHEEKYGMNVLSSSIPYALNELYNKFGYEVKVEVEYIRHPYIDRKVH